MFQRKNQNILDLKKNFTFHRLNQHETSIPNQGNLEACVLMKDLENDEMSK